MLIDLAFIGTAAVTLRSALKYRRNWDKNGPTVQLLRKFMPRGSKGFRVYVPIGHAQVGTNVVIPLPVRLAVRKAGFRITDYRAKRCVKLNDKEQKNVFNIGKVIAKDPVAKAAFDNDPQLQNSSTSEFTLVVSCHPYDIIGMSTGRDWDLTSCMRLSDYRDDFHDGSNSEYLKHDVAEGTLVAYAVRSDDTNIQKPLGRCLLKPFLRDDGSGSIFYRRETAIYGNPVPGLAETLARFLRKLNAGVPAGIYKLNEKLYNDGLVPRAENDGSSEGPTVDWLTVPDQSQVLRERPEMFADYANFMINRSNDGTTDTSVVINILIDSAKTIPARFVKPAARVLASPKFAKAFFDHAASSFSDGDSDSIAKFMQSPEFRRAVRKAEAENEEAPDTYRSLSFLTPKNAHRYFVREVKDNPDNYNYAAISYVCGTVDLLPEDIESVPELHKLVYKYAELIRESSVFGSTAYQESVHRTLSKIEPYNGDYSPAEIEDIASTLAGDKKTYRAIIAWYINACATADTVTADFLTEFIKEARFRWALRDRRMRKRILSLKNISDRAREMIVSAIKGLMENHEADDAPTVQRDLIAHMAKGFDCLTARNYLSILANDPDLFKSIWYSKENVIGAPMVEELLTSPALLSRCMLKAHGVEPKNDYQKNIFRIAKTFVVVIGEPTAEDKLKGEVDPEVLQILVKYGGAMRALGHFIINLADYPELLNGATYGSGNVYPMDLIGDDNGQRFLVSLREKDLDATQTLLKAMAYDFGQIGLPTGVAAKQRRVLSGTAAPSTMATLAKAPPENAVASLERFIGCVNSVGKFVENFPVDGTVEDWKALLPMMDTEHLADFNAIAAEMRKNQNSLKPMAQMFAMLAFSPETKEALKAALPPDWITVKDL